MNDSEAREALLVVLSTAASIGIDIEMLCHLAADELLNENDSKRSKQYAAGAVYQLGTCMSKILEPVDSGLVETPFRVSSGEKAPRTGA
ncbi:hypothetical protein [Pseudomonas viridiflava]|uniref:hypothetical protein n=1 Tax=Pseudomonas viridiflava TaxID=33069 RepID=UPI000F01FADA|nr:hypothetical protein [Pseudomonas viridiflava]